MSGLFRWMAISACACVTMLAPAVTKAEPVRGGSLSMILSPEPAGLVSGLNSSSPIYTVSPKMFDGLVSYDSALQAAATTGDRVGGVARRADHHLHVAAGREVA